MELAASRNFFSDEIRRWLSRWCRPMLGSSRIYSTLTSSEPICVAKRMRWLSPPDNVAERRSSERYSRPTSTRNPSLVRISLMISWAMSASVLFSRFSISQAHWCRSEISIRLRSAIFFPSIKKWRASLLSRCPLHSGHVAREKNRSLHLLAAAPASSSCCISRYFTSPS